MSRRPVSAPVGQPKENRLKAVLAAGVAQQRPVPASVLPNLSTLSLKSAPSEREVSSPFPETAELGAPNPPGKKELKDKKLAKNADAGKKARQAGVAKKRNYPNLTQDQADGAKNNPDKLSDGTGVVHEDAALLRDYFRSGPALDGAGSGGGITSESELRAFAIDPGAAIMLRANPWLSEADVRFNLEQWTRGHLYALRNMLDIFYNDGGTEADPVWEPLVDQSRRARIENWNACAPTIDESVTKLYPYIKHMYGYFCTMKQGIRINNVRWNKMRALLGQAKQEKDAAHQAAVAAKQLSAGGASAFDKEGAMDVQVTLPLLYDIEVDPRETVPDYAESGGADWSAWHDEYLLMEKLNRAEVLTEAEDGIDKPYEGIQPRYHPLMISAPPRKGKSNLTLMLISFAWKMGFKTFFSVAPNKDVPLREMIGKLDRLGWSKVGMKYIKVDDLFKEVESSTLMSTVKNGYANYKETFKVAMGQTAILYDLILYSSDTLSDCKKVSEIMQNPHYRGSLSANGGTIGSSMVMNCEPGNGPVIFHVHDESQTLIKAEKEEEDDGKAKKKGDPKYTAADAQILTELRKWYDNMSGLVCMVSATQLPTLQENIWGDIEGIWRSAKWERLLEQYPFLPALTPGDSGYHGIDNVFLFTPSLAELTEMRDRFVLKKSEKEEAKKKAQKEFNAALKMYELVEEDPTKIFATDLQGSRYVNNILLGVTRDKIKAPDKNSPKTSEKLIDVDDLLSTCYIRMARAMSEALSYSGKVKEPQEFQKQLIMGQAGYYDKDLGGEFRELMRVQFIRFMKSTYRTGTRPSGKTERVYPLFIAALTRSVSSWGGGAEWITRFFIPIAMEHFKTNQARASAIINETLADTSGRRLNIQSATKLGMIPLVKRNERLVVQATPSSPSSPSASDDTDPAASDDADDADPAVELQFTIEEWNAGEDTEQRYRRFLAERKLASEFGVAFLLYGTGIGIGSIGDNEEVAKLNKVPKASGSPKEPTTFTHPGEFKVFGVRGTAPSSKGDGVTEAKFAAGDPVKCVVVLPWLAEKYQPPVRTFLDAQDAALACRNDYGVVKMCVVGYTMLQASTTLQSSGTITFVDDPSLPVGDPAVWTLDKFNDQAAFNAALSTAPTGITKENKDSLTKQAVTYAATHVIGTYNEKTPIDTLFQLYGRSFADFGDLVFDPVQGEEAAYAESIGVKAASDWYIQFLSPPGTKEKLDAISMAEDMLAWPLKPSYTRGAATGETIVLARDLKIPGSSVEQEPVPATADNPSPDPAFKGKIVTWRDPADPYGRVLADTDKWSLFAEGDAGLAQLQLTSMKIKLQLTTAVQLSIGLYDVIGNLRLGVKGGTLNKMGLKADINKNLVAELEEVDNSDGGAWEDELDSTGDVLHTANQIRLKFLDAFAERLKPVDKYTTSTKRGYEVTLKYLSNDSGFHDVLPEKVKGNWQEPLRVYAIQHIVRRAELTPGTKLNNGAARFGLPMQAKDSDKVDMKDQKFRSKINDVVAPLNLFAELFSDVNGGNLRGAKYADWVRAARSA